MLSNKDFFNSLSDSYDSMIDFNQAVLKKKSLLDKLLIDKKGRAADLGCGTGVDSIALHKLGFKVSAFDISEGMIKSARKNALRNDAEIKFSVKSIPDIGKQQFNKYDAVISLGNSLANLDKQQFENSVSVIYNMLNPGGRALIQILNYTSVIMNKERIINITKDDEFYYIRFYDFETEWLIFNVLKYPAANPKNHEMISTKIFAHEYDYVKKLFEMQGFGKVSLFGSLNKTPFDKTDSKDLVVLAEK